jgi:hypothetical protein
MKTKIVLVAALASLAVAMSGHAVGVEIGVGTEPSINLAATWELSQSLTLVTSLGVAFGGGGVQTGSLTVQTPSYTIGMELRYTIRFATPIVLPYLGLGAQIEFSDDGVVGMVSSSAGVQIRVLQNVYVLGEGAAFVPIFDAAGWYWRLKLGVGFGF